MFWIVTAAVLAVVLVGAWIYDRRWGFDPERRRDADRAQAEVDTAHTRDRAQYGGF